MGILQLPKKFHTDFKVPNKKPIGDVEIDWSHPLTNGLKVCLVFQHGRLFNLVTNTEVTTSASGLFRKPNGNIHATANDTAIELVERADKGLYHVKNTGRNKVAVYSDQPVSGDAAS